MPEQMSFTIYLEQEQDYRFRADFGGPDVPSCWWTNPSRWEKERGRTPPACWLRRWPTA